MWRQNRIQGKVRAEPVNEAAVTEEAEPTKAEVLADLQQAFQESLAGDLRPALEVLDEIDREITDNADHCSRPADFSKANAVPQKEVSSSKQ